MVKKIPIGKLILLCIRQFFSQSQDSIVKKYKIFRNQIEKYIGSDEETEFADLAPVDNIEKGDEYLKALDWAFKNEKIHNIAMTGPYGSGKSSIIQTYLKMKPSCNYIDISLASFFEEKQDEQGENKSTLIEFDESKIEEGILKQLFYKVNYRKIPQSRYRKLHRIDLKSILVKLLIILTIGIGGTFFFFPEKLEKLKAVIDYSSNTYRVGLTFSWTILVLMLCLSCLLISYIIWWFLSKFEIKEWNLFDKASATMGSDNENSIFNKNMDEIIYFFETTKYDTIFIEDLDRFESTRVFIKLRELNTLLNNYEQIKRKIVFIYAIKDDLFTDKDRTKFFDFIIPIIPIINSTNSNELMWEKISRSNLNCEISMEFITRVSPYIADMRILTNIFNEFIIYKNTLRDMQGLKLRDEQMISLMIFKNLYPKEFAQLQSEEGIVKKAFQGKSTFITKKKEMLKQKEAKLQSDLEAVKNEPLNSMKELKASMLYFLSEEKGAVYQIKIDGTNYSLEDIMSDEFDLELLKDVDMEVYFRNGSYNTSSFRITKYTGMDKQTGSDKSFFERWRYLKKSISEEKKRLQEEIGDLADQEYLISALTLHQLIEKFGVDEVFTQDIRKNEFLVFLLRNRYIDETYANYINYFHPNSLTKDDMNFILGIRNHEGKEYAYALLKVEQVVKRLLNYEFNQKEIYNFDLLEYLLEKEEESEKSRTFLKQLADRSKKSREFIDEFIERKKQISNFIKGLSHYYVEFWFDIYQDELLMKERKFKYFELIMSYADTEDINNMNLLQEDKLYLISNDAERNICGCVYAYFDENSDILQKLNHINIEKMIAIIEARNILFSDLDCQNVRSELLDFIFMNSYYLMNPTMIEQVIKYKNDEYMDKLSTSNYTQILKAGYEPLIEYINEDFIKYMEDVCLELESNTLEDIDTVIIILKKIFHESKLCCELIEKEEVILEDFKLCLIDEMEKAKDQVLIIWNCFISSDKVQVSWNNVMVYYSCFGLTLELQAFMEKYMSSLIDTKDEGIILDDELIKTVLCSKMDLIAYEKFVRNYALTDFTIPFSKFDLEHMKVLVDCKYIPLRPIRYQEMKSNFPDLVIPYMVLFKDILIANLSDYTLEMKDIETLANCSETTEAEVVKLVETVNVNDISPQLAQRVKTLNIKVNKNVVEAVWNLLDNSDRIPLLAKQIGQYTNEELAIKFAELEGEYMQLADRSRAHQVSIKNTEFNEQISKHLLSTEYITSVNPKINSKFNATTDRNEQEKDLVLRIKKKI